MKTDHDSSKRKFIKTAAYVAPVILTLKVAPTFASGGSGRWNNTPGEPGQQPGNGGDGGQENGEIGASQSFSGSSSGAGRRKKRRWYWPFS